jgi:hypothetical protein
MIVFLEELSGSLLEIVVELSLVSSGSDSNLTLIVHDILENVGSYPPSCITGELHTLIWVESFDGLHEPVVTLLDEIQKVKLSLTKVICNLYNKAKIGCHKTVSRSYITFIKLLSRKLVFLFWLQQWIAGYLLKVQLKR